MASLEGRLDPARFVRVSRSSIVNATRVRELQPMFNGDFVVVLRDGAMVAGYLGDPVAARASFAAGVEDVLALTRP